MKQLIALIVVGVIVSSCTFYEPEFRGGEKFEVEKIDGKNVKFTAGATIYNGNWFGVKIKPSMLDLYVDGELMGKVHLDKKVKMKRKSETMLVAPFTAMLDGNALVQAMKFATKGDVEVRLKGNVKGGIFIFSKKFDIDKSHTMSSKSFIK